MCTRRIVSRVSNHPFFVCKEGKHFVVVGIVRCRSTVEEREKGKVTVSRILTGRSESKDIESELEKNGRSKKGVRMT